MSIAPEVSLDSVHQRIIQGQTISIMTCAAACCSCAEWSLETVRWITTTAFSKTVGPCLAMASGSSAASEIAKCQRVRWVQSRSKCSAGVIVTYTLMPMFAEETTFQPIDLGPLYL